MHRYIYIYIPLFIYIYTYVFIFIHRHELYVYVFIFFMNLQKYKYICIYIYVDNYESIWCIWSTSSTASRSSHLHHLLSLVLWVASHAPRGVIFMAKLWENPWKTHGCSWQITYRKPPFSSINREFPMETNAKKKSGFLRASFLHKFPSTLGSWSRLKPGTVVCLCAVVGLRTENLRYPPVI